jgi:CubicO group peptidase (beta-lactamase class C family)
LIVALLWVAATTVRAIDSLEQLQQSVKDIQKSTDTTAVAIAVIDKGEMVWVDAMGVANIKQKIPATPDTLFRIGSTSKMFVGLSVLKLVDEGRLDLNAPLRELAPEIVFENSWEAEHPVRLVHLLEHTSGWDDLRLVEYAHNEESPIALKEALLRYPGARTSRWVPGTRMAYSNAGPAVAAYIVEKVSGMTFEDYVSTGLFRPLQMNSATYFPPANPEQQLAAGYTNGELLPYWYMMHRPVGAVNASANDMVHLVQFFLNRGHASGERVISEASIARMETSLTTLGSAKGLTMGYGLANYPSGFQDRGIAFRGHAGGLPGATADLAYVSELNSGYAIMVSGDGSATYQIGELIREYLLRDHVKPELHVQPLPAPFQSAAGIYVPINPRSSRDNFLPRILGAMTFFTSDTFFHRYPL